MDKTSKTWNNIKTMLLSPDNKQNVSIGLSTVNNTHTYLCKGQYNKLQSINYFLFTQWNLIKIGIITLF